MSPAAAVVSLLVLVGALAMMAVMILTGTPADQPGGEPASATAR